jgi:hypothetical protein
MTTIRMVVSAAAVALELLCAPLSRGQSGKNKTGPFEIMETTIDQVHTAYKSGKLTSRHTAALGSLRRGASETTLNQSSLIARIAKIRKEVRVQSGYLTLAVASLRLRAAPTDKRPARPISGKGLSVWGNSAGSWASAVCTGSGTANTSAISTSSSVGFWAFK